MERTPTITAARRERRLAAIMFVDIAGYTAMMQEDEALALEARRRHKSAINEIAPGYSGEIVQYYGDGALLLFPSARQAVEAAGTMQRHLRKEPVVPVRVGIHLGDVMLEEGNAYGDCVNLASRIESVAVPGSVMFSDRVYQEIANQSSIRTASYGEFTFKNVKRPIGVYALDMDGVVVPEVENVASEKGRRQASSIAVMPFEERASDEDTFLAEGITEEITSGLTRIDELSVISSTSVIQLTRVENPLEEARKAGILQILEGKVRRAGNRIRVSVKLTNTADGFQVWADNYDRELDDIFEVQDDIARSVVHALKINFNISDEQSVVHKTTDNPTAHTMYLKAMHHWKRSNPEDTLRAVELFNSALSLDPDYAHAQCALSQCYAFLGSCGELAPTDAYARALNFAMKAISADPGFAEGHLAMANIKFYHFWDWEGARESLEKAESLGLNSATLHHSYGLYYAAVGKPAEGVVKMRKALELDPLSLPVMAMLGTLLMFDEKYDESISVYKEALDLEPSFRAAIQYIGVAYICLGKYDEAIEWLTDYHKRVGHPQKGLAALTVALYLNDQRGLADEYLERMKQRYENEQTTGVEIDFAIVYAGIGEYGMAMDFMEKVYAKRLSVACMGMIWVMRCPCFVGLWSEERFIDMMRRLSMPM